MVIIKNEFTKQRGRDCDPVFIWATQPHRNIVFPDDLFWE